METNGCDLVEVGLVLLLSRSSERLGHHLVSAKVDSASAEERRGKGHERRPVSLSSRPLQRSLPQGGDSTHGEASFEGAGDDMINALENNFKAHERRNRK